MGKFFFYLGIVSDVCRNFKNMSEQRVYNKRGRDKLDDPKVTIYITIPGELARKWGCKTYRDDTPKQTARVDNMTKGRMVRAIAKFLTENEPGI